MAATIGGAIKFDDSMTAVSSPQHNLDLQSKSMYRVTVSLTITGMAAVDGGRLLAVDAGGGTVSFTGGSASSSAANRIATTIALGGVNYPAGLLWYDPVSSLWRRAGG